MIRLAIRIAAFLATLFPGAMASAMSCGLSGTPQLAFGRYAPWSSSVHDVQGTFYLECTPASPGEILNVRVTLLPSFPGSMTMRNIATGEWLRFTLYQDPGRMTPVYGDLLFALRTPLAVSTRFPITLYGRIAAGQNVTVGRYRSRLTVLVEY